MKTSDRLGVLLAGTPTEERLRLRPVKWAADFLGLSAPTIYRKVADGTIPHVKISAGERSGGRGDSGAVRFRLVDLVAMSVENEVATPSILAKGAFPRAVDSDKEEVA